MRKTQKNVAIGLSVLLIGCLLPMPYGYFMLIRFLSMAIFAWFAYEYYQKGDKRIAYILILLVLLFQPFIKVALTRLIWNIVDVIVAGFLIYLTTTKEVDQKE